MSIDFARERYRVIRDHLARHLSFSTEEINEMARAKLSQRGIRNPKGIDWIRALLVLLNKHGLNDPTMPLIETTKKKKAFGYGKVRRLNIVDDERWSERK